MSHDDERIMTTGEIAKYCKVSFVTAIRWIDRGRLRAHQLPGRGDRRVELRDFLMFLHENNMPIPRDFEDIAKRVLVVDDELNFSNAIHRVLKKAGFEVKIATDGFAAGQLAEIFNPAVITIDLNMPGLSGIQVIERIRVSEHLKHVKILVISGMPKSELEKALMAGADDILEKPFENRTLVEKVSTLAGVEIMAEVLE